MRTQEELSEILKALISHGENETAEFKEANDSFSTSDIGKYFSALANESNLRDVSSAWLVFGVNDKTLNIVGTNYRENRQRLDSLKNQIAEGLEPKMTFKEIYELNHVNGRVVMFEIPPAPQGMPISWQGHYYARAGESLIALGIDKLDQIRAQNTQIDWTAQIVPSATLSDLDPTAVSIAKEEFIKKNRNRFPEDELDSWDIPTFLDRAKP